MVSGDEKRRKARKEIQQVISVYDAMTQELVGHVVNLNDEGFMVIGSDAMKEECLYQFNLKLSTVIDDRAQVSLGAECLWRRETDSGTQFWAGFHIIDISVDDLGFVKKLLQ